MKRTCYGCRALRNSSPEALGCDLGYDMDRWKRIPKEDCPKPRTNMQCIEAPSKTVKKGARDGQRERF